MDVRIGVTYTPKEIEVDLDGGTNVDALKKDIEVSLKDDGVLWLTDRRGRTVGIPGAKIAYIELGTATSERRVGFGIPAA